MRTLKEAVALYDELYKKGQEIIKEYNPCKIKVIDGKVTCVASRQEFKRSFDQRKLWFYAPRNEELCCGGCRHLTRKGCRAKSLSCKLWLCSGFNYIKHPAKKELDKLSNIAYRHIEFMFEIRCSKKESIEYARRTLKDRRFRWL